MRANATDVTLGMMVYVCFGHTGESCKNGWTNQDLVWGADSRGPKNGGTWAPPGDYD